MQSAEEKARLLKRYGGEEPGAGVAVLKCLAGVLALIAVGAGPWLVLNSDGGRTAAEPPAPKSATTYSDSIVESKRVFDERRRRYASDTVRGTPPVQGVAAADAAPSAEDRAGK